MTTTNVHSNTIAWLQWSGKTICSLASVLMQGTDRSRQAHWCTFKTWASGHRRDHPGGSRGQPFTSLRSSG